MDARYQSPEQVTKRLSFLNKIRLAYAILILVFAIGNINLLFDLDPDFTHNQYLAWYNLTEQLISICVFLSVHVYLLKMGMNL